MENGFTGKERFIKALNREPLSGHPPHFELVFFLTMEVLGKVHPSHRYYSQWNQMSETEKKAHFEDMADLYISIAEKYHHDAIFVHPNPGDIDSVKRILDTIREKTGDEYYLMLHGDPTLGIPDGENMIEFSVMLYEEPEKAHEMSKRHMESAMKTARALEGTGLLDGFTLCSDYAFNVNPFYTPDMFAEFVFPYLRDIIAAYKAMGFYTIKHTDGNINPILDQIVAAGPHGLHSIDPQGGMDLAEVRRLYGDKICTIGNVNCGLLQTGTLEEAEADTRRCLREGMEDGRYGFIFSTSNCVYTGLQLERYERMHDIWRQEGVYTKV